MMLGLLAQTGVETPLGADLVGVEMWLPIAAVFIPILTAIAVRSDGSNKIRASIAILASGLLAVLNTLQLDDWDWSVLGTSVGVALATELVFYLAMWQHLNVNEVAPRFGIGGRPAGDNE